MTVSCDILNTGSELVLGRTLNRHGAWLGQQLAELGILVRRQLTLPDGGIIREEMERSLAACDLVVVTGGLGPTLDDLTREVAAELLGLPLESDPATEQRIAAYLKSRGRCLHERQRRQALVPAGATLLPNDHGTAPGLWFGGALLAGRQASGLVLLPGPPRELHPMFSDEVLPRIRSTFRSRLHPIHLHVFCFAGIGEGDLAARLDPLLAGIDGLEVGYCAHASGVMELRLLGTATAVASAAARVRPVAGPECFSEATPSLEQHVVTRLAEKQRTVTVAESCTGGAVLSRITDIPGASAVLGRGFVVYANTAKTDLLSVNLNDLQNLGAVSEAIARQMAEGALRSAGADHALALTGVAGPDGGSEQTPVGTVWVALASTGAPTVAERHRFVCDRPTFKAYAGTAALNLLRRRLDGLL